VTTRSRPLRRQGSGGSWGRRVLGRRFLGRRFFGRRFFGRLSLAGGLLLAVLPGVAHADDKSAPAAAGVTPPEALSTPVDYPEGASGTAEVVLELVVSTKGEVTDVRATSGAPPFTDAAVRAAKRWRFEPARRGGEPIATRILFQVRFEQTTAPEEPSPEHDTPGPGAGSSGGAATGEPITEIVVWGQVEEAGARTFSRAEVRNLPGAFDDPLRSIEVLPGVTPIATFVPMFFIRGAPPGNVGFFIDEIRVPLLYHAFLGPSVIHPALIKRVDMYGGPMPARIGRYAGAAVEATLVEPDPAQAQFPYQGEASVRLLDAGAYVEAPWADGRGYAVLAGRYSYTALLLSMLSQDQRLDYWDYQGLVGYRLGNRDTLSIFGFGAFDFAGDSASGQLGGTEFHRVDLRWDHDFSARTRSRAAFTWGRDRTRSNSGYISDDVLAGRVRIEHRAAGAVYRGGGDFSVDRYGLEVDPAVSDPLLFPTLFPERTDLTFGAWADAVLWPEGRVSVTPGIRADVFQSMGRTAFAVDPRLTATYRLTDSVRTVHGVGVAHQTPNFVPQVPGAQVGGLPGGLQRSVHASAALEVDLPGNVSGSFGGFVNATDRMSDPIGLSQTFDIDERSGERRAFGRSAGLELYLKKPLTDRLGGLLSYTFSRASRTFGPIETIPGYERPHVLNAALTYDFGRQLRLSTKFVYASGIPGRRATERGEFVFLGDDRSRPFVRLDLKVSKRWVASPNFWWGLYGEVVNATHGVQVVRRVCGASACRDEGPGAITVPSVGIEAAWR
jgi:TonB family protein